MQEPNPQPISILLPEPVVLSAPNPQPLTLRTETARPYLVGPASLDWDFLYDSGGPGALLASSKPPAEPMGSDPLRQQKADFWARLGTPQFDIRVVEGTAPEKLQWD